MSLEHNTRAWFYASVTALVELGLFCIVILFLYLVFKKWGVMT